MAFETLVAAFDNNEHAMAAVNALKAGGYHADDISILDQARMNASKGQKHIGLWQRLFGDDINRYEATVYGDVVKSGGVVVSVRVPREQVAQAAGILDLHHPINVHDRAVTSGAAAEPHVEAARKQSVMPLASDQDVAVTEKHAQLSPDSLRLAEEQLEIGKRMVETGRTRVRRFTTESDVEQDVTLHEEHAEVLRKAVSQPAPGDVDWSDREIEVAETKEQALVRKTAKVVEEISLRTKGDDHIETIHDKLRRQQAEVEKVDTSGKPRRA
jgi:stress response protein YsnF